jgi:HK97 family phage major capsid protein
MRRSKAVNDISGFAELVAEFKAASAAIEACDSRFDRRLDGFEANLNDLMRRAGRPGAQGDGDGGDERKDAIGLCLTKHMLDRPKDNGLAPGYAPSSAEIDEALRCKKALVKLFRTGELNHLDGAERKSLTSFSLGAGSNFILPPQMSNRVLSCLVEPFNLASLVHNETISAGSIKFPIDNSRMNIAAWACEASCFANNPQVDLADGLGELEIKAEPLRFVACAGNDLLQDAAFGIEMWLMGRVARGFEQAVSTAILIGNGLGMPQGMLNPRGGIPICETAAATAVGAFTWQDLVSLAYEVPVQWHDRAVFLMNQRTLGLCLTISDAAGRPLLLPTPLTETGRPAGARFSIAGFPVIIANVMPDVAPGSTPILFGDLEATYTLINRKATTMTPDPYSGGFCTLFRFEARVGGATTCSNAARLLRIR